MGWLTEITGLRKPFRACASSSTSPSKLQSSASSPNSFDVVSIGRLSPLVGLPPAHFDQLYRGPVRWLAATCEASDKGRRSLEKSLAFAESVLLVRQAYLLPAHTAPEDVARRSDCWTYAVFLAALFHHSSVEAAAAGEEEAWADAVLSAALPRPGHDWIARETDLPPLLRAVLLGNLEDAGILAVILKRAKAAASSDSSFVPDETKARQDAQLEVLADMPAALAALIKGGQLPINRDDALAWVTTRDLWLKLDGGFDLILEWLISELVQLPPSNNDLMDELLRQGIFVPTSDTNRAIWRMVVFGTGKSKVESLLRVPVNRVWPDIKDRPAAYWGKIQKPQPRPGAAPHRKQCHGQAELE